MREQTNGRARFNQPAGGQSVGLLLSCWTAGGSRLATGIVHRSAWKPPVDLECKESLCVVSKFGSPQLQSAERCRCGLEASVLGRVGLVGTVST